MRSIFLKLFVLVGLLSLGACLGKHNQAPNKGVNLDSERVYGVRGAEPKQLPNKYPEDEDGSVSDRIAKIREDLYPKTATTDSTPSAEMNAEADTTSTDTTGVN